MCAWQGCDSTKRVRVSVSCLNESVAALLGEMESDTRDAGSSDLDLIRAKLELEKLSLAREQEKTRQREYELKIAALQRRPAA